MLVKYKKILKIFLITLFWLGVWELISLIIGNRLIFPSIYDVIKRIFQLMFLENKENHFILSIISSLGRIGLGIAIGIFSGAVIAFISSFSKTVYDIISPFITVIKATPVASFIILLLVYTYASFIPIIISALMVFPIVFSNVYQGIKNVDASLLEMCKMYSIPRKVTVKTLYIPSILPYFTSALISSIGLGWKAGIAAEVLCTPLNSIGKAIFESKIYFEYVDLFAWTAMVIILSIIFEVVVTKSLKKLLSKITHKYGGDYGN